MQFSTPLKQLRHNHYFFGYWEFNRSLYFKVFFHFLYFFCLILILTHFICLECVFFVYLYMCN